MAERKPYRVDDLAWAEVDAADEWYCERSEDAGSAFFLEVIEAFETISQAPQRWPEYLYGTRRYLLHHFPSSIVYLDDPEAVTFAAVSHNKRRPGY
jgi:plasmid stabilization system protein ParE